MLLGRLNQPWLSTRHRYWPIFTRGAMYQGLHHASQSRIWSKTPFPKSADTAPLGLGDNHSPLWEPGKKASGKWDPDKLREPVSGVPETTLSFTDSVGEPTGLLFSPAHGYDLSQLKDTKLKSAQRKSTWDEVPPKQGTSIQGSFPRGITENTLYSPAKSCNNKSVKLLSAGEAC